MPWFCYSCQAKNPNSAATCIKCGGTVALPKKFYIKWVFGSAAFFMATFILGSYLGGILMALSDSEAFRALILRIWPALLFVGCGIIVGFASDGITILEAGLGSILGQGLAVSVFVFFLDDFPIGWIDFVIGALPGAGLAIFGAWIGEKIQLRKEQAGGING
jgi:hypothetical protein